MPYHLELGSDGHRFLGNKAIVVNSITGHHLSKEPIPLAKAEAQMRIVEQDAEKKEESLGDKKRDEYFAKLREDQEKAAERKTAALKRKLAAQQQRKEARRARDAENEARETAREVGIYIPGRKYASMD